MVLDRDFPQVPSQLKSRLKTAPTIYILAAETDRIMTV